MPRDCLFCQIVAKELPATIAYEDPEVVAFHDVAPQAPVHLLVVPRRHLARISELQAADAPMISHLVMTANQLARTLGVDEAGYRLVMNCNAHGGQTVFHVHLHLLGGRPMRWPPG